MTSEDNECAYVKCNAPFDAISLFFSARFKTIWEFEMATKSLVYLQIAFVYLKLQFVPLNGKNRLKSVKKGTNHHLSFLKAYSKVSNKRGGSNKRGDPHFFKNQ